ncbi:MAG TPA: hypothetical protein VER03_04445 [Bryobacteraceae bacterium]|nr:hypothetical protein [Bryobacteraceae bacterium]
MNSIRSMMLGILAVGHVFAGELTVRNVTHAEAVTLLTDKALLQPRVEVILRGGQKIKGRLVSAGLHGLSLERGSRLPVCDCQSVKVLGAMARPRRIARGIVLGAIGGLYVSTTLLFGTEMNSETLSPIVLVGFPMLGGWAGGRLAERGNDLLYVLRAEGPDSLCGSRRGDAEATPPGQEAVTPPLLPLPLLQP